MPLLHRKLFSPILPPSDLDSDEEVFHCPLTNEIFRDYEEFYERTILCNSLVWSCSITEKPNLTYQEALDCEEAAKKKLSKVSTAILKPLLFLVGLSNHSRVDELNEDLFTFVKDRYFIGETVEVQLSKKKPKQLGKITKVLNPSKGISNGHLNAKKSLSFVKNEENLDEQDDDDDDDVPLSSFKSSRPFYPDEVRYIVHLSDGTTAHISKTAIRRKQGIYNRQSSKLYLKGNCYKPQGLATEFYVVKQAVKDKLCLDSLLWEDIFVGPPPTFLSSKVQKIKKIHGSNPSKSKLSLQSDKSLEEKELKLAKELEKEERKKTKEEIRKKKAEELERIREAARIDKERKRKEREEEMIKLKVEKEQMKHQKQEEKRRLTEYLKEWSRPRDDLECDDLQDLPPSHEIHTKLPHSLFGEALSFLEFFNTFGDLFDAADEFPDGVTITHLIRALTEYNHDGPLCDILFFFLSNLFRTQAEEEEGCEEIHLESSDQNLSNQLSNSVNDESLQAFCTLASTWSPSYQGFPLQKLELDSYTVSEVLRLYLITSASRPRPEDRLWRLQQRGGYAIMDDSPLNLCLRQPHIIEKLSYISVFDLKPEEKVCILSCLLHHLLSFVATRDNLDDAGDKLQQAQQAYRDDRAAEKRRERDLAVEKSRFKCEQLALEKNARIKEMKDDIDVESKTKKKNQEVESEGPHLLDPFQRAERLRIFDEEENQAKEAWNFRCNKHFVTINKLKAAFRISPIGLDRYYRRYWNISSLPGVLVEEFPDNDLTADFLSKKVVQKKSACIASSGYNTPGMVSDSSASGTPKRSIPLVHSFSDGAQSSNLVKPSNGLILPIKVIANHTFNTNSATIIGELKSKPPALQVGSLAVFSNDQDIFTNGHEQSSMNIEPVQGKQHRWSIYKDVDELDVLINALNPRGYRESKLRESLTSIKDIVASRIKTYSCHLSEILSVSNQKIEEMEKCEFLMENLLREQILDFEARIWGGTLGVIKVSDRNLWRESVQTSTKYDGKINENLILVDSKDNEEDIICNPAIQFPSFLEKSFEYSQDNVRAEVIKQLATALLIVERSVDRKYLKHPLGWAVDARKGLRSRTSNDVVSEEQKKNCCILLQRWERSLLNCTSLSQIFLHLSTLERSITWSRSILNAKCRICRRKGDGEKMLLCDSCDRGHHMYCLRPALKIVPSGDWFCPECNPKSAKISPRKVVRTKRFVQVESSEEESSEEENDDDDEDDGDGDDDDDDDDVNSDENSVDTEEPIKRKLTYKVVSHSKKTSNRSYKTAEKRSIKSENKVIVRPSKRRSAGVWKDLSSCEEILSDMIKHKDSWPFLDPVSRKLVPDYYSIIKKPMDLGTVLRKLKNVQYSSPSDFIDDVDLIFHNCYVYNDPRSNIAKTASCLKAFFNEKLQEKELINYRLSVNKAKKRKTN